MWGHIHVTVLKKCHKVLIENTKVFPELLSVPYLKVNRYTFRAGNSAMFIFISRPKGSGDIAMSLASVHRPSVRKHFSVRSITLIPFGIF